MRKFLPYIIVVAAAFIDTSVLGVLSLGWATPMLAFTSVIAIGLLLGRITGMMTGLAAGLIIDITAGFPLGLVTVMSLVAGYISGLAGRRFQRYILTPVVTPIILLGGYEAIMAVYQFIAGQSLEITSFYHALIRVGIQTVLAQGLYLLYNIILKPSWSRYAGR